MVFRLPLPGRGSGLPLLAVARSVRDNVVSLARARLALRLSDHVGRGARVFGAVQIVNSGAIRIGEDVALGGALAAVRIAASRGGIIGFGDQVTIEYGSHISARSMVSVGNRVRIGPYCVLSDADVPPPPGRSERGSARGIMVGDDAWLGACVTLMPGVRVGRRAVVAAGSVVTTDIPDDALAAGSPATVLRFAGVPLRIRLARTRAGMPASWSPSSIS